jgi:Flp pilus assembly protein TadD
MPRVVLSNRLTIGALAFALTYAATAQAQPVVQPLPGGASRALSTALARIAANPRDSNALIDAGNAALGMNDVDAAIGFFTRAREVSPRDVRAVGGLAGAHLRNEDPYTAIGLFNEAELAGPLSSALLAERGLAYDLVGDNVTAQRYYQLAGPNNDEAVRRLALSLAISGDRRGSEAALSPLILRQDKSAWRTRAFSLAILGDEAQAVSIANATMPASLATGISPYLRYMRQLTRAQQAAAANLGHFPRASEIGRDDPRMAQYSPPSPRRPATGVDAGLVPSGQPLGATTASRARGTLQAERPSRQERREQDRQAREARTRPSERVRPPEPVVAVSTTPPPPSTLAPSRPATAPVVPARPAATPAATPRGVASAVPATAPAVPGFALAPAASAAPAVPPASSASPAPVGPPVALADARTVQPMQAAPLPARPAPVPAAATPAPRPTAPAPRAISMADAFGDFARPAASIVPAPGAVDIRRVAPPRPAAAKPAVPAHPSRIWVQLATGRNKHALGFDWRKMAKDDAALFRARKPFVTAWGQANRLLTGPFETEAAAGAFLTQLRRADVEGAFLWTSPAGQIVDALPVAK